MNIWTYTKELVPSDPINVLFRRILLVDIFAFLRSNGWGSAAPLARTQYLLNPDIYNMLPQNEQLSFTPNLRVPARRLHIRLWNINGEVLGAIHIETWEPRKNIFDHTLLDFDAAKITFAGLCRNNAIWKVVPSGVPLNNRFAGHSLPFHDGYALLVQG